MKRKYLLILFLNIALLLNITNLSYAEQDRILARVNDDIITLSDLTERLKPIMAKYERSYSGQELLEQLAKAEEYWLNQLIENKLILQDAVKREIDALPDEVEERYEKIRQDFDSELQFNIFLESQGMNIDSLKNTIKENIIVNKATSHIKMKAKQQISPLDVVEYYEDNKEDFTDEPSVHAYHIMIRSKDNDELALNTMKMISEKIKEGEDFSKLATEYSEGPHAKDGGDLGFLSHGQHIPEIDQAVFRLGVGEVSDIIKTSLGYHIVKVVQKKKNRVKPLAQVQDEIENIILRDKAKEVWDEWIKSLKEKAYIEIYKTP